MHSAMQKNRYIARPNVMDRTMSVFGAGSASIWTEMQYPRKATITRSAKATKLRPGSKLTGIDPKVKSKNRPDAARNGICRRRGGSIVSRNSLCGPARRRPIRRTRGVKTKNGVSMNGPWPAKRSMRSAPTRPMLATNKMYCSFRNVYDK